MDVEVVFLNVLAVIALLRGEAEASLFQTRGHPIPQCQSETHHLVTVADSSDAVFSPAISARTRVVVRERLPGSAAWTVILPDRSPLPLGEIGPPPFPMLFAGSRFFEPTVFSGRDSWHGWMASGKSFRLWSHFPLRTPV